MLQQSVHEISSYICAGARKHIHTITHIHKHKQPHMSDVNIYWEVSIAGNLVSAAKRVRYICNRSRCVSTRLFIFFTSRALSRRAYPSDDSQAAFPCCVSLAQTRWHPRIFTWTCCSHGSPTCSVSCLDCTVYHNPFNYPQARLPLACSMLVLFD